MRDANLLNMHLAILGVALRPESDPDALWDRVASGEEGVLLTLRWLADEAEFHSLTLTEIDDQDRLHFHNPLQPEVPPEPGETLRDDAPPRVYHAPGDESVTRSEFLDWFAGREALGYIPEA